MRRNSLGIQFHCTKAHALVKTVIGYPYKSIAFWLRQRYVFRHQTRNVNEGLPEQCGSYAHTFVHGGVCSLISEQQLFRRAKERTLWTHGPF